MQIASRAMRFSGDFSISSGVMPMSLLLVAPPGLNTEWLILIAGEKK